PFIREAITKEEEIMGRLLTVILTTTLALLPMSVYADPVVRWSPSQVVQDVPIGTTRSFQVEFGSASQLTNVAFRVVPALAPYVRVEPATFAKIDANVVVPLTIRVNFTSLTSPIDLDGVVQVTSSNGKQTHINALPLPVVLHGTSGLPGITDITFFS